MFALAIFVMPELKNKSHERFAWLIAEGKNYTEAYSIINPESTQPGKNGSQFAAQLGVKERIAELKEEIQTRSILKICRKRELLRQMAEGTTPTKVIRRANGQVEAIFDRHLAIVTDAKMAGEFAPEKREINVGPTLKLSFDILGRNTALPAELEAELVPIVPEPDPVALPAIPDEMPADYSKYEEVKIDPERSVNLEDLLEVEDVIKHREIQTTQDQALTE